MDTLPDDVLLIVLRYACVSPSDYFRCCLVSARWHRLCMQSEDFQRFLRRYENFLHAKWGEQADRYHEVVEAITNTARMDVELTTQERQLLSTGFKNLLGDRRAAWRILSSMHEKEISQGAPQWRLQIIQSLSSLLTFISYFQNTLKK